MKPIFKAIELFKGHDENFSDVLEEHLVNDNAWVYCGEECFVMATLENKESLLKPNLNKLDTDTWFVYVYAGDLERVLTLIPFPKKYVGFRRNNGPLKFYELEKLLARIRR